MSTPSMVRGFRVEHLLEAREPLLGIDGEHLGLNVRFELAALVERFEKSNLVAQSGRLFIAELGGGRLHLATHLFQE
jgi:hypothetical protein